MKNICGLLLTVFLAGCIPDISLPAPTGPYLIEPMCEYEEDLYFMLGSPDYCYPDMCCVWGYHDMYDWYCEETWCKYEDFHGCWWQNTEITCY